MATRKAASTAGQTARVSQCHFISNTHWDREWRFSMQRTRHMLVYMLDMLFDMFEKEPRFKYFHMDSQTVPLEDYLEVRPEMRPTVEKYVRQGQFLIGPWFCLPDEFCVGGESLVRNLLAGHKIGREFGKVSKTGYSPFSWGQISQMPQIYKGFGIDMAMFYRGVNTYVAPRAEFLWEGADGTRIVGSRLARRPRYNVWYVIQRPAMWNESNENNRVMSWKRGHGPMKFISEARADMDYQYVHPAFAYYSENVPARAQQAMAEQDADWTTPHRFWSAGHDSSCPDVLEVRMMEDSQKALAGRAEVFHSTVAAFQEGVKANLPPDLPVATGEMRHLFTKGSTSPLIGWVISARTYLKQENFRTERALTNYAEPAAVFASLLGAPYPQGFLDVAYNWLLQNQGHDSIGGCSRDVVHTDMLFRYRQANEIGDCVLERAMVDMVGAIDLSAWPASDMAAVIYNPAHFMRSEVVRLVIDIPNEWASSGFEMTDEKGRPVPIQINEKQPAVHVAQSPNDTANTYAATRYFVDALAEDIPGFGYRTFRVRPAAKRGFPLPGGQVTGPQTMENEHLAVRINANGTLTITDKATGRTSDGAGYFRDSSEVGNPWEHIPAAADSTVTTLNEKAEVTLVRDGPLETIFRINIDWSLPEGTVENDRRRSDRAVRYPITNTVTLRKGQRWVDVVTELDNTVENHYLQVAFPTGIKADHVMAQGQFDTLRRPSGKIDGAKFDERPMTEHPMNSFVDISDGQAGLALLNEGLKAYSSDGDAAGTMALTLLRCYPLRICVTQDMLDYSRTDKGSQCPGRHAFHYAIMPHAGDFETAGLWQAADQFNLALQAVQVGPTPHGRGPLSRSFLEVSPEALCVSAVKRSESGKGWVVRLFNPTSSAVSGKIHLNGGLVPPGKVPSPVERRMASFALPKASGRKWKSIRQITLEELPEKSLKPRADGSVRVTVPPKKIVTIEFKA